MVMPPMTPNAALAREQVNMPATLLMVWGVLGVLGSLGTLAMQLLGTGLGAFGQAGAPDQIMNLMSGALGSVFAIVGLALDAFMIYGGMRMKDLNGYGIAMGAAIVAILPCTWTCCCPLGAGAGIWALIVLMKPEVKGAFVG